nr:hypothetical protein [Tanacetum cinerariifolium]
MRTHSSSNLHVESPPNPSTSNPKRCNHRLSKQHFILEESPVDTMTNQRTMAELLRAPTEGYAEAIVVPSILAEKFKLKHSLINMMTSDQFFGLEKDNPHDHIRWGSPSVAKKRTTAFYSHLGDLAWDRYKDLIRACHNHGFTELHQLDTFYNSLNPAYQDSLNSTAGGNLLERRTQDVLTMIKNKSKAWDRYKDLLRACHIHGFTELHQLDTFYNSLNPAYQDSLNSTAGGNMLERRTQDVLTMIKNKSKVRNSQKKSIVSQVKSSYANFNSSSEIAKPTHAVNQQTSVVITAMTVILKQFQATPPPASVKAELRDNIQGYVAAAAVNYNQEDDERVEETLTDQDLVGYTIKVSPPLVQKLKPSSQRNFVMHQRDPLHHNILYPSTGGNVLIMKLLDLDSTKDLHPSHNVNPLSGSIASSSPNHLLEEFADELAVIIFPPGNDDLPFDIESDLKEIEYFPNHDPIKDMDSILNDSIDQSNLVDLNDNVVDTMPKMFTDEHALDYSSS